MPNEAFLTAAGGRNHAGKTGLLYDNVGRISVSQASLHGVDENLWACLKRAVDVLRLAIHLDSIDGDGQVVTVNRVGAVHKKWHAATLRNPHAVRLAEYLLAHGFQAGEEVPPPRFAGYPALLFGPAGTAWNRSDRPHTHHLHLSLPRKHRTGVAAVAIQ